MPGLLTFHDAARNAAESFYPEQWSGLVGAWPLIEGGGQTAFDWSGNGNVGTLTNGPAWAIERWGSAVRFDGLDDHIACENAGGLHGLQSFSLSVWVKWEGSPQDAGYTDFGHIAGRQWPGTASNCLLCLSGSNPDTAKIRWRPYTFSSIPTDSTTSPGNTWHHVCVVHASGSQSLYVDGVLESTRNISGTMMNNAAIPLTLGAWIGGGASYSKSVLQDARTYSSLLSAGQVQSIYSSGPNGYLIRDDSIFGTVQSASPSWLYAIQQTAIIGGGLV